MGVAFLVQQKWNKKGFESTGHRRGFGNVVRWILFSATSSPAGACGMLDPVDAAALKVGWIRDVSPVEAGSSLRGWAGPIKEGGAK